MICSDFHAYFIALCCAVNIPARFIIGAAIPSERNEGGFDSYHCCAEFYAGDRWWPVDLSEADKYNKLVDYYFGNKSGAKAARLRYDIIRKFSMQGLNVGLPAEGSGRLIPHQIGQ